MYQARSFLVGALLVGLATSAGAGPCPDLDAKLSKTAASVAAAASETDPAKAMAIYVDAFKAVGAAMQKPGQRPDLLLKIVAGALELTATTGVPFYTSAPGSAPRMNDWFEFPTTPKGKFTCSTADTAGLFARIAKAKDALPDIIFIVAKQDKTATFTQPVPTVGGMMHAFMVPISALGAKATGSITLPGDLHWANCRVSLDGQMYASNCDVVQGPSKGKATISFTTTDAFTAAGVPALQVGDQIDFIGKLDRVSAKHDAIAVTPLAVTRVRRHDQDLMPFFDLAQLR